MLGYDKIFENAKIQKLTLTKAQFKSFAIDGQNFELLGDTKFSASFDSKGDYSVKN